MGVRPMRLVKSRPKPGLVPTRSPKSPMGTPPSGATAKRKRRNAVGPAPARAGGAGCLAVGGAVPGRGCPRAGDAHASSRQPARPPMQPVMRARGDRVTRGPGMFPHGDLPPATSRVDTEPRSRGAARPVPPVEAASKSRAVNWLAPVGVSAVNEAG